jgi:hypothetical protein
MTTAGETLVALIDLAPTVHGPSAALTAAAVHALGAKRTPRHRAL